MEEVGLHDEAGKLQYFQEPGVTEFPWDIQNIDWGLGTLFPGQGG